jgi:hypothetical protein
MTRRRLAATALTLTGLATAQQEPTDELRHRVQAGAITAPLLAAFEQHVLAAVHDTTTDAELAQWLDATPRARATAAWVWARLPQPAVFARLQRLWRTDQKGVRDDLDLAFGIAAAWSAGSDEAPARAFGSWTEGRAAIPTIEQSFAWFRQHERELAFPIARVPWLALAFTGLNDVPLAERDWVLQRYRSAKPERLRSAFAEVPYIGGGLDGHAKTLANMVEHGGVCTVNTQYAMSVMRTLGFPATFGGGPGHCWPCWLELERGKLRFERANYIGNRDGVLGESVFAEVRLESDLRRLAEALNDSTDGLRRADCAAAAARLVPGPGATRLLRAAIDANPLAATAWLAFAQQCRDGIAAGADDDAAKLLLRRMPRALAQHPDLAVRVLRELDLGAAARSTTLRFAADLSKCCASLRHLADESDRADLARELQLLGVRLTELQSAPATAWAGYHELAEQALAAGEGDLLVGALDGMDRSARAAATLAAHGDALRDLYEAFGDSDLAWRVGDRHWRLCAELGDEATAARVRWDLLVRDVAADAPACRGGGGGSAFDDRGPGELPLVGVRWSRGDYHGIPVVGSVQPLFRAADGELLAGDVHGVVRGATTDVLVPDEHFVVGLTIASGNVVDGFAIVFARRKGGAPDPTTVRFSPWCGGSDRGQRLVRGEAIGLCGRAGDLVDALGVALR